MPPNEVTGLPPRRTLGGRVNIPASGFRRFRALFGRALRLHCPYCGGRGIFRTWFDLRAECPTCGTRFEREDGYFLGGYAVNLIVAEFLAVGLVVAVWLLLGLSVLGVQVLAVASAVVMPILFFPYSRCLWMALDLLLHPPGGDD